MAWLVAVEGIDGSGKGTQSQRLVESLQQAGATAALISFPRYQQTRFGAKIGDFLNGRFGALHEVHPLLVSLLFAGDRHESRAFLLDMLDRHDVVVCDRYVASNIAHQTAKAPAEERAALQEWIEFLEYEQHQLPRADQTLWLDLPVVLAQQWIARKQQRSYTDRAADLQEADAEYLQCVHDVYAQLATTDATWQQVSVATNGVPRSIDEIAADLFTRVSTAHSAARR